MILHMVYNYIILRFLSCALPFYLIYQHLFFLLVFPFFCKPDRNEKRNAAHIFTDLTGTDFLNSNFRIFHTSPFVCIKAMHQDRVFIRSLVGVTANLPLEPENNYRKG